MQPYVPEGRGRLFVTLVVSIAALRVSKFETKTVENPECLAAVSEGRM